MAASQCAERERVTWAVPCAIPLWKSVENSKAEPFSGETQKDEIGNTKFEIRKSETQAEMAEKTDPPFQKAKPKG